MYQPSSYAASSPSPTYVGTTSPPPPSLLDPYRSNPISLPPKQVYHGVPAPGITAGVPGYTSPPPPTNGFSPMPTAASSRYPTYNSSQPRPSSSRGFASAGSPMYTPGGVLPQQTPQQKYKGTLAPGQIVKVGDISVRIERYLSEGGFAHVYLTTSDQPIYPPSNKGSEGKKGRWGEKGYTQHCLKRIAFDDERVWIDVKKEIQVMKSLPSNPHLTQFLGSAHARLPNGGYEVFILMEFCPGGGIIDLLNKRLRDRLKEIEILNIFVDVCEGVAAMHALKTPLLHRDLKIENVLSGPSPYPPSPARPSPLIFKLCDFGSTTFPSTHPPQNKIEAEALAMDLNKNTTLQYRSPEMVEPMLGWAVGLPSDVWALGVLLYKLCYYTTPFEEHGTLAIVNAKYTFPQYPVYSPRIQHLIASMLVDHPARRPTVFEILKIAHEMQGTKPEIDYPTPSRSFTTAQPAQSKPTQPPTGNLLDFTSSSPPPQMDTSAMQPTIMSGIQPQRRGRPTREPSKLDETPPMPQPPAIPNAAAPSESPKQLATGDKDQQTRTQQMPEKKASLDAFGLPSQSSRTFSGSSGFGDSFGASPSSGVASVASKFGSSNASRQPSSKFGVTNNKPSNGISPNASAAKSPTSSNTTPHFPVTFDGSSTRPAAAPRKPSSSIPDGETSFETRFPSLESLGSPSAEMANLISPISPTSPPTRPALQAKASIMGHLTGDTASPHQSTFRGQNEVPQPRSTQVTGTAFKGIQGGLRSASPQGKTNYFDGFTSLSGDDNTKEEPMVAVDHRSTEVPPDLMGDGADGDEVSKAPLIESSSTPSEGVPPGLANPSSPPGSSTSFSHSRPLLPPLKSPKPNSNFNDTQWSPLERLKSGGSASSAQSTKAQLNNNKQVGKKEADSSDEEDQGPESASWRKPGATDFQRNTVGGISEIAKRKAAFENPSSDKTNTNDKSSSATKAAPSIAPKPALFRAPSSTQGKSPLKTRPASMYNSPSSPVDTTRDGSQPASATELRPSHDRKSSIGELAEKFETTVNVPSNNEESSQTPASAQNGSASSPISPTSPNTAKKPIPTIAAKPAHFRKNSIQQISSPEAQTMSSDVSEIKVTTKPISPAKPASLSSTSNVQSSDNVPKTRPLISKKPSVKHGDMPVASGYSKSSSGRSFPIYKSPITADQPNSDTAPKENQTGQVEDKEVKREGSPDKQQSVNSLIARWNKGNLGAK